MRRFARVAAFSTLAGGGVSAIRSAPWAQLGVPVVVLTSENTQSTIIEAAGGMADVVVAPTEAELSRAVRDALGRY